MWRSVLFSLIIINSAVAQCGPQGCGQVNGPFGGNVTWGQPVAQQSYEQDFKQINDNFESISSRLKALEDQNKSINDSFKNINGRVDHLFKNDQTLEGNINGTNNDLKILDNKFPEINNRLNVIDEINNKLTLFDKKLPEINNKFTEIRTELNDFSTRIKTELSNHSGGLEYIAKGASESTSTLGYMKWLLAGSTGISGIALGVAIWAIKKRGPAIVKHVYEHVRERHNDTVTPYVPPPEPKRTEWPTEGQHPHIVKVNQHDNQMGGRQVTPIVVQSPPPEQLERPTVTYVPVDSNAYRKAVEWSLEEAGKRYPGQTVMLDHLQSLINQHLNAQKSGV